MRRIVFSGFLSLIASCCLSQTLFTYGKNEVSKNEFITAFNKNPNATSNRKAALKEYLALYINFKLKVQAAYDAGLDKDASQLNELGNFRRQIADNIINQQANVKALVTEAFNRSRKDIHLAQVLIEVPDGSDTADAYKKIQEAYKALKEGKNFETIAAEFSTDAGTKSTRGDLGFVTAFTLAYRFENVAYSLRPNGVSSPFRSKYGYHIFKNLGERKALGTRRVAHILIAMPPNATEVERLVSQRKADSVYAIITKGASFEELAGTMSNDINSAGNNGMLPEFGINTYDPQFEQVAFALTQRGEISKPFATAAGYHMLKLIEVKPVPSDISNTEAFTLMQDKVSRDGRMALARKALLAKQLKLINYKPAAINQKNLYEFTDSAVLKTTSVSVKGITDNTLLFSFAKKNVKAGDWLKFVRGLNTGMDALKGKAISDTYQQFLQLSADEYYRAHLEEYSLEFKKQLKEFKEANMLFGVMEKSVWAKANEDTTGLEQYYNKHKEKYTWSASADALVITCTNEALAKELEKKLANNLVNWKTITAGYNEQVTADSGRFELAQLPVASPVNYAAGLVTSPVKNTPDGTYTFNYIIKVYNNPDQRSFEDARGMVISDYQQVVEDRWITELKKKYPVKINTAMFNSLK
jgi:peptidyl-prolyl cis-trans isomerase SurA